jgi:hypothetical protein
MDRIGRPKGLVRYASLDGIERGEPIRVTPRLVGYTIVLMALIALELFLIFGRSQIDATFLRAPGSLFQTMPSGRIANLYLIKLINKTARDIPVQLRLENPAGSLTVPGPDLVVPGQKRIETSVLIELDPALTRRGSVPVRVGVFSGERRLQTLRTAFIGPRDDTAQPDPE